MCTYIYVCMRYVCNFIRMWVMVTHCHCCIVVPYMTGYIMTHSYTCVPLSPRPACPRPSSQTSLCCPPSQRHLQPHDAHAHREPSGREACTGRGRSLSLRQQDPGLQGHLPLESCDSQPPFCSNSAVRPHWPSAAEGAAPGSDLN